MKTAMKQLLEEIEIERNNSNNVEFREALDFVKSAINQDYLKTEKQQIRFVYNNGFNNGMATKFGDKTITSEEFYNETFKQ